MKNYRTNEVEFKTEIQIPEPTDPAHADVINTPIKQLFGNTIANRKFLGEVEENVRTEISAELSKLEGFFEKIKNGINKDLENVSLDILIHLEHYKMHGESSYVFRNKKLLHELYECIYVSMNDLDICEEAFEWFVRENKKVGHVLAAVFDIQPKEELEKLSSLEEVLTNERVMDAVLENKMTRDLLLEKIAIIEKIITYQAAMNALARNLIAMEKISSNLTVITKIAESPMAISAICNATYNTTKPFIKVINNNDALIKKIFDTVTASSKFKLIKAEHSDNMSKLNELCNTPNTIILCAMGRIKGKISYGVDWLVINNEYVVYRRNSDSNAAALNNPQNVSRENVNAIAVPNTVFKNDDGYIAILVYQAI